MSIVSPWILKTVIASFVFLGLLVPLIECAHTASAHPLDISGPSPVPLVQYPQKNLFIFTTVSDFKAGRNDGTEVTSSGNGAISLRQGVGVGTYTSPEIKTEPFEYMILSWNAETPYGSYIEIQGRVRVKGQWSKWLSWGRWSSSYFLDKDGQPTLPGCGLVAEVEDSIAKVDTDELYVKGQSGETADAFQYRLVLRRADPKMGTPSFSPKVRLVAATLRNTLPGQAIGKVYPDNAPDLSKLDMDLNVPTYSQQIRYSKIAGSICSPTSIAMILGYRGYDISPEESAWSVRDYQARIFGNWPFNTAYPASLGLTSYVDYMVPTEGKDPWYSVKLEIASGNPVVVSVRYRKPGYADSKEPEVEGVPINSTSGHLVVIRGFTWKDGIEYVIVNDPAAPNNDQVKRLYRADQFFKAWSKKVAYVVHLDREECRRLLKPPRIVGELVASASAESGYQKYQLQVGQNTIDLSLLNLASMVVSRDGAKPSAVNPREAHEKDPAMLWFDSTSKPGKYRFWFIDKLKNVYQADVEWKK